LKLLSDATTPFGRKVVVAAIERSIPLEEIFVPLDGTGPLDAVNPLRQIPTLVLPDGVRSTTATSSSIIWTPATPPNRWCPPPTAPVC
jgi:glutathione S-transferase